MESPLTLKKSDLETKIGVFLGYGRGASAGETAWNATQTADIKDCLDSGIRRFYYPKLVEGQQYSWSFLRPIRTIVLHTGNKSVTLWDDFGGLDEEKVLVNVGGSNTAYRTLIPTNPEKVRTAYAFDPTQTGQPILCGVQTLEGVRLDGSSRHEFQVFPAADQDYTYTMAIYLRPGALSNDYPYAYGGPEHSETILESCLAIAEERRDDMRGVHNLAYEELLPASISADRRMRPQNYGRNTDRSDARHSVTRRGWRGFEEHVLADGLVDTSQLTRG